MPDPKRVRWSQLKVGLTAIAALTILAVLVFLLTGREGIFETSVPLYTYMSDSAGMAEKAPVRLNGILVGNVDEIRLSGLRDPGRVVRFTLSIRRGYLPNIPVDSTVSISAANLLGDKFINITKGINPQHVRSGATLRSVETKDVPELMAQSADLLQTLQSIVTRADKLMAGVEAGEGNIGKFMKDEELYRRLNAIASESQKLLVDIRTGRGTLSKLLYDDSLYQEIRQPVQRLNELLSNLQAGRGTAGKLLNDAALYDEARQSLAQLRTLVADLNAGKGTAGMLLKDEVLYRNVNQILERFASTMDRLNSGQGTLGQLIVNPQMYESLNAATREFQQLAKDIRANPKKFLEIKLALF